MTAISLRRQVDPKSRRRRRSVLRVERPALACSSPPRKMLDDGKCLRSLTCHGRVAKSFNPRRFWVVSDSYSWSAPALLALSIYRKWSLLHFRHWPNVTLFFLRLPPRNGQIIVRLKVYPELGRGAKISRQSQGHLRGDAALLLHDFIHRRKRHARSQGQLVSVQPERNHKLLAQDLPRMNWL